MTWASYKRNCFKAVFTDGTPELTTMSSKCSNKHIDLGLLFLCS